VRKDLKCSSPGVQAGHCVAEFCLSSRNSKIWNNQYLIYLEVENLDRLNNWLFKFKKRNIEFFLFKEPDLDNEITAICCLLDEDEAGFLSDLKLLV